ncbi:phosphatase PAP2 family protein [Bradyrhizobium sp.]|uniref:phosphatase PAP2 family protein n=1 Tax=Bradyrhizobium sp. TaxID=376 RepID=UPI00391B19ED
MVFPWSGWEPDLFGVIALAEFGQTNWRRSIRAPDPPHRHADIFTEIDQLAAMARDERPRLIGEILDQNARLRGYFAEVLMMSAWSHPNSLKIIEMAIRVAQMVAIDFKLRFNRARPQQVCPALVPLINSPGHASFPSAHSLESHLIALALAEIHPRHTRRMLVALADRIGRNREVAGVHYPSDTHAGKVIAHQAFELLKDCPTFKAVSAEAKREPGKAGTLVLPPGRSASKKTRGKRS